MPRITPIVTCRYELWGTFLFDDTAAKSVMAAYRRQGVDLIVDREHDSLNEAARVARSNAGDALAHFKLALRNGELWASDVIWNSAGAADLASKTRRYISPAFHHDKDGRVVELLNCALVSMPATHSTPALVAASKYGAKTSRVISAPVTHAQLSQLERAAARRRITGSELIRLACLALAASESAASPAKQLSRGTLVQLKARGMSVSDFEAAKLNVMRRTPEKKAK